MSSEPQSKKSKMSSTLDQLKQLTTIVADTGDFEGIKITMCFSSIRWVILQWESVFEFVITWVYVQYNFDSDIKKNVIMKVTLNGKGAR